MQDLTFHTDHAWIDGVVVADVLLDVVDGRFAAVTPGVPAPAGATRLPGLTLPGLANAHSHAFHRALRGRTQDDRGSFWTWRERMYRAAEALDPETYHRLARAVYAEMALAGITCVGEFHYLHHGAGGVPYEQPNAMGEALIAAAGAAGIRITLLDACYLTATVDGAPLDGVQRRFGDRDAAAWAARVSELKPAEHARVGAAVHSVRAVPVGQMPEVVAWATARGAPLHAHLSEQRAENEACAAFYGRSPTEVLDDAGALGPRTTVVHATHLSDTDRGELGDSSTAVCFCPTTERDLADGIGPARALVDGGSPLCLGSDSHAVIDLFEEMRAVELDERLASQRRGHWSATDLLAAGLRHDSLGWDDAGAIAAGKRADLVTIATDHVRTAGTGADERTVVFAAVAEDVVQVVADGRVAFREGDREQLGRDLDDVMRGLW